MTGREAAGVCCNSEIALIWALLHAVTSLKGCTLHITLNERIKVLRSYILLNMAILNNILERSCKLSCMCLFSALVTSTQLKYSGYTGHHTSGKTHATEKCSKEKKHYWRAQENMTWYDLNRKLEPPDLAQKRFRLQNSAEIRTTKNWKCSFHRSTEVW